MVPYKNAGYGMKIRVGQFWPKLTAGCWVTEMFLNGSEPK
jgi:hypothetical protein